MEKNINSLDRETQLLISTGAAVAAGCIPCLNNIVEMARADGIAEWKLKIAARTGQFIKEQPANMMKAATDEVLGTHLMGNNETGVESPCPLKKQENVRQQEASSGSSENAGQKGCGCS